jgi:nitroimidazol reductase NimA-like FMN-containing flavoprotein (pyridoxamine 5'-phosphate oxidase superfamily)
MTTNLIFRSSLRIFSKLAYPLLKNNAEFYFLYFKINKSNMGVVEINNKEKMIEIISSCKVCCIGMVDKNNNPYVLPFNFGIKDEYIWFHSSKDGKKIETLKNNPKVCVSFSTDYELGNRDEHVACSYFMKYKSVLVYGEIETITDYDKKIEGMNIIMNQYTKRDDFKYNLPAINNVNIFKLKINNITGRYYI